MAPRSSWSECSVVVRKSFRLNQALAHSVPNKISFTEDDNHMLFLAGTSHSSLYTVNLDKDADEAPEHQKVFDTQKSYVTLSKEEELSRERRRVSKQGLTSFEYSDNVVLVPLGTNLYHNAFPQVISEETDAIQEPQLITSDDGSPYFDTKLCPTNCNIISFVKQDDIHITFVKSKQHHRLTYLSKPGEISAGVPPFVIQEEFDRYTGYYWRPVQENATTYHILFEKVYQRYVNMVTIPGSADGEPQVFRYPRAGQVNAFTTLAMVKFTIEDEKVSNLTCFRLQEELTTIFPWVEYIPWLGWHPSGNSVWAMLLDRRQKKMALIDIPLAYFKPNETFEGPADKRPNTATIRVLYSRNSDTWIDVSDNMYFFNSDPNKFIMLTEEKFAHLWCHTLSTEYDKPSGAVALTKGEWSVTKLVGVDEERGIVYFHALVDPTQQHLYSVTTESEVKQLTTHGYYHSCSLNNAKDQFVTVYSNLNTHYACSIHSTLDGAKLRDITLPMDFRSVQLKKGDDASNVGITSYYYTPPILKTVNIDGDEIKCIIYPPKVDDLSKPCPVVLYVYGGPAIQLVVDRFRGIQHRQHNLFATLGYCVVIADCPGSANRGKVWAERLYKQMGVVEVDMQIKVLKDLATQHSFMDLERVAIIGTSYGGYISLMAMGQRSDFFKLSIAICPATSWLLYDTAYSERYMGLPTENQEGYTTSSVMHYVEDFPDEDNRVLIIHGLLDENVHFSHTTMLIDALIAASKPYNLLVYPRERHGIGRGNAPEHCDTNIAVFLKNHL